MATASHANASDPPTAPPLWPLTVDHYAQMVRSGILGKERVYLWKGRLAPRMTTGRPRTNAVLRAYHALFDLHLPGFFPEPEQPMALRFEHTALYPDVKLVRGRP